MSNEDLRKEQEARSLALEKAYVHDAYDQIAWHCKDEGQPWPKVQQFLNELEPGSLVADIGCGNGNYFSSSHSLYKLGVDRCSSSISKADKKTHPHMLLADNLTLPVKDGIFDAALSIAVIHHFTTTERRVRAIRELARILKTGGKLMISVWAMKQRNKKCESQDILVPWRIPNRTSSSDIPSNRCTGDCPSTGQSTTDEDGNLQEKTISFDSRIPFPLARKCDDSCPSHKGFTRQRTRKSIKKRDKSRGGQDSHKGTRSSASNISSEELLLDTFCSSHSSSELSSPNESCYGFVRRALQKFTKSKRESGEMNSSWLLSALKSDISSSSSYPNGRSLDRKALELSYSQINIEDVPIELRYLDPEDSTIPDFSSNTKKNNEELSKTEEQSLDTKSRSLTDLHDIFIGSSSTMDQLESENNIKSSSDLETSSNSLDIAIQSSSSFLSLSSPVSISDTSVDSVRTNDSQSSESTGSRNDKSKVTKRTDIHSIDSGIEVQCFNQPVTKKRPLLTKQKTSINEVEAPIVIEISKSETLDEPNPEVVIEEFDDKDYLNIPKCLGIIKQRSLNDEFIFPDRFVEKEKIKQGIQKQSSLNEDLIYGNKEQKHESLREILFKAQFRRFQVIRESFEKIRTSSLDRFEKQRPESLKNGIVKLLQSWRSELLVGKLSKNSQQQNNNQGSNIDNRYSIANNIFRRSRESFDEADCQRTSIEEIPVFNFDCTERKSCTEDSSDSSKENSFQSDTSIDSEDSCISVIFVPKPNTSLSSEVIPTNRSLSSESSEGSENALSPKSPKSPRSPNISSFFQISNSKYDYFTSRRFLGPNIHTKSITPLNNVTTTSSKMNFGTRLDSIKSIMNPPPHIGNRIVTKITPPNTQQEESLKLNVPTSETYRELFRQNSLTSQSVIDDAVKIATNVPPITLSSLTKPNKSSDSKLVEVSTEDSSNLPATIHTSQPNVPNTEITTRKVDDFYHPIAQKNNFQPIKKDSNTKQLSSLLLGENVEIIRKPALAGARNVQIVRKTVPKFLTFEVFNPETDDLDSDNSSSTSTSSTHSESSVIERGWPTTKDIEELDKEIKRCEEEERYRLMKQKQDQIYANDNSSDVMKLSLTEPIHIMDTIKEETQNIDQGFDTSDGRRRRCPASPLIKDSTNSIKTTIATSSSESQLICRNGFLNMSKYNRPIQNETKEPEFTKVVQHESNVNEKGAVTLEKHAETTSKVKMVKQGSFELPSILQNIINSTVCIKSSKKNQDISKIENAKGSPSIFPLKLGQNSFIRNYTTTNTSNEHPKESHSLDEQQFSSNDQKTPTILNIEHVSCDGVLTESRQQTNSETKKSLKPKSYPPTKCKICDNENNKKLAERLHDSKHTQKGKIRYQGSLDSSSFSSSNFKNKSKPLLKSGSLDLDTSLKSSSPDGDLGRDSSLSTSQNSLGSDTDGAPTLHRYYHVFREKELDYLIEKYVQNLHIISSYYDHANWCVIAEKVQVWTI